MNILPHKSWHVRTKANIARVRKDEAKAAEEEKEIQRRIELAESEARTAHLREKAKEKFNASGVKLSPSSVNPEPAIEPAKLEHVNLFRDVEEGTDGFKKTNEEHEKEEKETREKYEKSIGYLTYLGQDTKVTSWYQTKRLRDEKTEEGIKRDEKDSANQSVEEDEKQMKDKQRHDPLSVMQKYVGIQKPSKVVAKRDTDSVQTLSSISNNKNQTNLEQYSRKAQKERSTSHRKRKKSKKRHSSNSRKGFKSDVKKECRKRKRSETSDEECVSRHKRKKSKRNSDSTESSSSSFSSSSYSSSSSSSSSSHSKHKRKHKDKRKHEYRKKRKSKKKKRVHSSESSSQEDSEEDEKRKQLEMLRQARLKREREEKARAEKVLAKLRGEKIPDEMRGEEKSDDAGRTGRREKRQKYNSQYNPEIAKQNKD